MAERWIHLNRRQLAWLLVSAAITFALAYSVFGWLGAVARISGWTGLPQYEMQIPKLRVQAQVWETLELTLPFLAALSLWLGRQKQFNQDETPSFVLSTLSAWGYRYWAP
jgi:hypothetical protein